MAIGENVALFDMDGTVVNYVKAIHEGLDKLRNPDEQFVDPFMLGESGNNPKYQYLWDRMSLIKDDHEWWANLPVLDLGMEILKVAKECEYQCEILTQSPKNNPRALAGKLTWILRNLGEDIDFTMTRNKSRHYGKVLVDDFPGYFLPWLEHRPRGLVIMPVNQYNKDFKHPKVINYDGSNLGEVKEGFLSVKIN